MNSKNSPSNSRLWLGIALIVFGMLLFLQNLDFRFFNVHIFSWQTILICIGVILVIRFKESFWGFGLIIVGIAGIITKNYGIALTSLLFEYWPILLIIFGIHLILKRTFANSIRENPFIESDSIMMDEFSVLSDSAKILKTNNFLGGKGTSILSELKLDLRNCSFTGENIEIELLTILGSIEIYIPQNWNIVLKTTAILGAVDDERLHKIDNLYSGKTVTLKGLTILGSTEIKN